jgi:hypothetical protein
MLEKSIYLLRQTINWWVRLGSLNKEDPFLITILKILFRLVGIVIAIAVSPFLLLIAFLVIGDAL